jgi:DNA-binding NtrC family response regulator
MDGVRAPCILLVEDDPADHVILQRVFADAIEKTYRLHIVTTITAAVRAFCTMPLDLIITDFRLPDGNGIDLIRLVHGRSHIPVVILTCYGDEKMAIEAKKAGAHDYIDKSPASFAALPLLVDGILLNLATNRDCIAAAAKKAEQGSVADRAAASVSI